MNIMNIITDEQKKVIFDSVVYINLCKREDLIEYIQQEELRRSVHAYASPWVVFELMQNIDHKALNILKKHCSDSVNGVRLIADPVAQVYAWIYRSESKLCASLLNNVIDLLSLNSEKLTQINVSEKLKQTGQPFSDDFPSKISSKQLKDNKDAIKKKCAKDIVNHCIKINLQEKTPKAIVESEAINFVIKNFDLPLSYYYDLLLRKGTQKVTNKEKLCHDQRDWNLIFYAVRKDVFVVTEDQDLLKINAKNIMSFEVYRDKILSN